MLSSAPEVLPQTAAMIKQLSFQVYDASKYIPPHLEVSGATIGQLKWDIITQRHVLYYRNDSKWYLFYNWDGTNRF